MKPTEEQLEKIKDAYLNGPIAIKFSLEAAILYWESIRPPCPNCTNPPGVRDMIQKAQIRQLWDNLEKAQADIAELNQRLHERTQAFLGKAGRAER